MEAPPQPVPRPFGVVGLDLSLKRAAACFAPLDWGLDWKHVRWLTVGGEVKTGEDGTREARVRRLDDIASAVVRFVEQAQVKGRVEVVVENYAFDATHHAHQIGEVGGGVRLDLYRTLGIVLEPVTASSARKVLLGKNPRRSAEAKEQVLSMVRLAGGNCPNHDASDAFAVMNWKLCEYGAGLMLSSDR